MPHPCKELLDINSSLCGKLFHVILSCLSAGWTVQIGLGVTHQVATFLHTLPSAPWLPFDSANKKTLLPDCHLLSILPWALCCQYSSFPPKYKSIYIKTMQIFALNLLGTGRAMTCMIAHMPACIKLKSAVGLLSFSALTIRREGLLKPFKCVYVSP